MHEDDKRRGNPRADAPKGTLDEQRRRAVRARALRHLRRWVAAGAAGSAVALEITCVVSDPAPAPIVCPITIDDYDFWAYRLHLSAAWEEIESQWRIQVRVNVWHQSGDDPLAFDGVPTLSDATLLENTVTRTSCFPPDACLTFSCLRHEGARTILVTVPFTCDGAAKSLSFAIEVTPPSYTTPDLQVHL